MAVSSPHLEAASSSLVGREQDLAAASSLLLAEEVRLLTFTGPAGVGKTRLALEMGRAVAAHFPDGVAFVDLAPIHHPGRVLDALAKSLIADDGPAAGNPLARLEAALRDRCMLLILDNAEQVLPAASGLAELLAAAPRVTLLVTSREPLHLRWEQLYHVSPLAVPDPQHLPPLEELAQIPSVALFLQRARALDPDFGLTEDNSQAVAELVVHLDGLPLAIELAAARTTLLSPRMIVERLGQRLSLFHWGARDLPERQQTLRDAIAWSYDLLSPDEQALFRRLGIFAGRFSLDAAEAVHEDTRELVSELSAVEGLSSLVDKSLVQVHVREGGAVFYSLLESIHDYAFERLMEAGELEAVGRSHALYYLALAERAEPELTGPRQREWFLHLEEKQHNLRAAMEWLLDHDEVGLALRLATALGHFWEIRGHLAEGRRWLEAALARASTAAPSLQAKALTWLGAILVLSVDETGANGLDPAAHAEQVLTEGLELARTVGDTLSIARALTFLGTLSLQTGEWERGRGFLQEAQTHLQEAGHDLQIIQAALPRGIIAFLQGQHEEAMQLMDEILSRYRDGGDDWGRGVALLFSMSMKATRGDVPRAVAMEQELLALSVQSQSGRLLYLCAAGIAWLARSHGQPERLARLVGATESIYQAMGLVRSLIGRLYLEPTRDALQTRLGQEDLDAALRVGRRLSFPEVAALIREVLEETRQESAPQEPERGRDHAGLLSQRELEVLRLVAEGLSNKQIAHELIIAESTVRYHLTSIFNKLGVDTRTHALAVAAQRGLVQLGEVP